MRNGCIVLGGNWKSTILWEKKKLKIIGDDVTFGELRSFHL